MFCNSFLNTFPLYFTKITYNQNRSLITNLRLGTRLINEAQQVADFTYNLPGKCNTDGTFSSYWKSTLQECKLTEVLLQSADSIYVVLRMDSHCSEWFQAMYFQWIRFWRFMISTLNVLENNRKLLIPFLLLFLIDFSRLWWMSKIKSK